MPTLVPYWWEYCVNVMASDLAVQEMVITDTADRPLPGGRVSGDRVSGDRVSGRSFSVQHFSFSGYAQYLFDLMLCCVVFSFSALAMIAIAVTAPVLVAISALAGLLGQKPKFRWQSTKQA